MCSIKNEAEVDEKLTYMWPVVVLETLNLSRYVTFLIKISQWVNHAMDLTSVQNVDGASLELDDMLCYLVTWWV